MIEVLPITLPSISEDEEEDAEDEGETDEDEEERGGVDGVPIPITPPSQRASRSTLPTSPDFTQRCVCPARILH